MDNERTFTSTDIAILYTRAESLADANGLYPGNVNREVYIGHYVREYLLPTSL